MKIIFYNIEKKDNNLFRFYNLLFKFKIVFVLTPIALVFFIMSGFFWFLTKKQEELFLFITCAAWFFFFIFFFIFQINAFNKRTKTLFKENDLIELELRFDGELIHITNLRIKQSLSFKVRDMIRVSFFKKAIIIKTKDNDIITFPNKKEIKEFLLEIKDNNFYKNN